jgi:hypothetical protein
VQFDEMARVHHQWIRQALAGFPGDQQAQLFELLATLKLSIAKE